MEKENMEEENNLLDLSVIVPLYNEEENILALYQRLKEVLNKPSDELHRMGLKAKEFVVNNKSNINQSKKIYNFIRECVSHDE